MANRAVPYYLEYDPKGLQAKVIQIWNEEGLARHRLFPAFSYDEPSIENSGIIVLWERDPLSNIERQYYVSFPTLAWYVLWLFNKFLPGFPVHHEFYALSFFAVAFASFAGVGWLLLGIKALGNKLTTDSVTSSPLSILLSVLIVAVALTNPALSHHIPVHPYWLDFSAGIFPWATLILVRIARHIASSGGGWRAYGLVAILSSLVSTSSTLGLPISLLFAVLLLVFPNLERRQRVAGIICSLFASVAAWAIWLSLLIVRFGILEVARFVRHKVGQKITWPLTNLWAPDVWNNPLNHGNAAVVVYLAGVIFATYLVWTVISSMRLKKTNQIQTAESFVLKLMVLGFVGALLSHWVVFPFVHFSLTYSSTISTFYLWLVAAYPVLFVAASEFASSVPYGRLVKGFALSISAIVAISNLSAATYMYSDSAKHSSPELAQWYGPIDTLWARGQELSERIGQTTPILSNCCVMPFIMYELHREVHNAISIANTCAHIQSVGQEYPGFGKDFFAYFYHKGDSTLAPESDVAALRAISTVVYEDQNFAIFLVPTAAWCSAN